LRCEARNAYETPLDEELVNAALGLTGARTKNEVVHLALQELVRSRKKKPLTDLAERIRFRSDLDHKSFRKRVRIQPRADRRSLTCVLRSFAMPTTSRDLLEQALELPLDERARMAADLLESLSEAEEGVEAAWTNEIMARVASVRSGEIESTDWRVVLDRVEKDVLGR
jgi:Arc/MetJ family transcription regulator